MAAGLYVDQYIAHKWELGADFVFDFVAEDVGLAHGHVVVHADVHVEPVAGAAFAAARFFDVDYAGDRRGDCGGLGDERWVFGVEEFAEWFAAKSRGVVEDNCRRGECGPVVGGLPTGLVQHMFAKERDGDADECEDGGERIGTVVHGISGHGCGAIAIGSAAGDAEEAFFDCDDGDEDDERVPRGGVVGRDDFADGFDSDADASEEEEAGDAQGSE